MTGTGVAPSEIFSRKHIFVPRRLAGNGFQDFQRPLMTILPGELNRPVILHIRTIFLLFFETKT